ncbi:hypothetical protein EAH83_14715 [Variovorax ginsengisoli]|uniref:Uncharacterized protein n=1 Tax=Variovorax guangxiensis TaxID=1775474 RepID=A0A502DUL9_9BURK|nr:hypothetical protein EAH83_14715 [Variovorax ginsengisoli]TPG27906.1 hypothetical protein EAH82_14375 [Variovorax guangxiensis]
MIYIISTMPQKIAREPTGRSRPSHLEGVQCKDYQGMTMDIEKTVAARQACIDAILSCVREGRAYSTLFFRQLCARG